MFDWDDGNLVKCAKHGVSIGEVEQVLSGDLAIHPDPAHSGEEERFKGIGVTTAGRYVFVVFTWRERGGQNIIRPISARYMHQREVNAYEAQVAEPEDR